MKPGDLFKEGRYLVLRKLGWGHFSTVWLVADRETGREAALKVQKSAPHYAEAARDEVELLSQVAEGDPGDERHCVRLLDWFEHAGPHGTHVCMVFEVLGDNLLSLIKAFRYRGVPLPAVRALSRQVLVGLDYLHSQRSIIHTDLKPENVMLAEVVRPKSAAAAAAAAAVASAATATAAEATEAAATKEEKEQKTSSLPPPSSTSDGERRKEEVLDSPPLTKGQKKKAKKKAAKAAAAAASAAASAAAAEGAGGKSRPPSSSSSPSQRQQQQQHRPRTPRVDPAALGERLLRSRAKIVDFGNACWTHKQFTSDIQTRQYRSPEVREFFKNHHFFSLFFAAWRALSLFCFRESFRKKGEKERFLSLASS